MSLKDEILRANPDLDITPENKCDFCVQSLCCRYATQQIDTPRSIKAFDMLLWQISHDDVELFKDEAGWFLLFQKPCTHLQPDGRCGIYEVRPFICREHENDYCEFDESAENGFDLYFPDYESLDQYCRTRFKKWDKRFEKA